MSITVNTNIQALKIQTNLSNATAKMNTAMERLSSGSKINSAADDAAGSTISTNLEATLSSSKVASQNAQIGANLLTTAEGTLNTISSNLQRIRDLAEQAANGTYDSVSREAMRVEVEQRGKEIDRLAANTQFNGKQIFGDTTAATGAAAVGVDLQVGTGSTGDDTISLDKSVFAKANVTAIGLTSATTFTTEFASAGAAKTFLTSADTAIKNISDRKTLIGAYQNRLASAMANLTTQQTNLASTNSTIKDADTAEESANYVKYQILQSASSSLLTTANSQPQIALSLIKG
jgi:flagellin